MGTPEFAVPSLEGLIRAGFKPVLAVSQPDKPRGRNQAIESTPVKKSALLNDIEVFQPEDINNQESIYYIKSLHPDIIITVAYGAYLGAGIRKMCPFGAINVHPSMLPKHRGADPIRSTLLDGDIAGVTVFYITAKMDSGPIIVQEQYDDLQGNMTFCEQQLAEFGSMVLIKALDILSQKEQRYSSLKKLFPEQDNTKATYSMKVDKLSNVADFTLSTESFLRHIFAYAYEPGYYCIFRGKRLKIFDARELGVGSWELGVGSRITRIVKNQGFVISLQNTEILITEVQYEGKKRMSAWDFHLGARLEIGEELL